MNESLNNDRCHKNQDLEDIPGAIGDNELRRDRDVDTAAPARGQ